jgi:hypothetical protein
VSFVPELPISVFKGQQALAKVGVPGQEQQVARRRKAQSYDRLLLRKEASTAKLRARITATSARQILLRNRRLCTCCATLTRCPIMFLCFDWRVFFTRRQQGPHRRLPLITATCCALNRLELAQLNRVDFLEMLRKFAILRRRVVEQSLARLRSSDVGHRILDEYIARGYMRAGAFSCRTSTTARAAMPVPERVSISTAPPHMVFRYRASCAMVGGWTIFSSLLHAAPAPIPIVWSDTRST